MALKVSTYIATLSPVFALNKGQSLRSRVLVRSLSDGDSVKINGASYDNGKDIDIAAYNELGKKNTQNIPEALEPLWDDGYGIQTLKDLSPMAQDFLNCNRGPPRWFCPVACGMPLKDSPVLMYLPGIDGSGLGLMLHAKSLGKVFHVQCLHIPVWDRTPFEDLIQIVEETVKIEHALSPNKPIYLLGDSFGGCLALAVAARNPTMDLILILANPATSYEKSSLLPLLPLLRALPEEYCGMMSLSIVCPFLGDVMKVASFGIDNTNYPSSLWQLFSNLSESLALVSDLRRTLPKDTLMWRLNLLKSAAAYANSRLHVIKAEVLVLASGKDKLLPSKDEARRLSRLLKNCNIRVFEDNGHTILMESGVNVLAAIKATLRYRRSSKHDIIKDFLPPSTSDFKNAMLGNWWYRLSLGATFFSTMEDGTIVRGLAGIPDEGPVLVVSNHLLGGFDAAPVVWEFLGERKIMLHGLAHPDLLPQDFEGDFYVRPLIDTMRLLGALPVTGRNLFTLLSRKSYVLLYPGGAREALHRKGEAYKMFWPDKQEFVRMAVKFGATIVPLGVVGEDDILELVIDYNEMMKMPFMVWLVNEWTKGMKNIREGMDGEISNQQLHIPLCMPKLPGRLYYLFGKPIKTKGKELMLDDKDYMQDLYLQIKHNVEQNVAYLMKKREEDPYRGVVDRFVRQATYNTPLEKVSAFKP